MLLENTQLVLDCVTTVPEYKEKLREYHKKKMFSMSIENLQKSLSVTNVNNQEYLLAKFEEILFKS